MDWEFLAQLFAWLTGAALMVVLAARLSPAGTRTLTTFKFWSLPLGAILPGCILLTWVLASAGRTDHPALATVMVLIYVALIFWCTCFVSIFLSRPEASGWRMLIGVLTNALGVLSLVF